METENHDWLGDAPITSAEEGKTKEIPASPAIGQQQSRRRVDTMSSVRSHIRLKPKAPIDEEHEDLQHYDLLWSRIRLALREPFAESFGTFIMVLFGDGESSALSNVFINHTAC